MKPFAALLFLFLAACNSSETTRNAVSAPDTTGTVNVDRKEPLIKRGQNDTATAKTYANQRFRRVKVEKFNNSTYHISGQGQVFEARFGWVVEDGHNELASGNESTVAGAPEWGHFSFQVTAQKQRPNSTLHLVLFENSAKDGSRQHKLSVPLQ